MTTRIALSVFLAFALILPAASASADQEHDWNMRGWYIHMNGFGAISHFDDDLDDLTGGNVVGNDGAGLNVRGGYQILSWLAVEGMYEYVTELDADVIGTAGAADNGFTIDTHNIFANVKMSLPFWRIQPYIILGIGGQRAKFDSKVTNVWVGDDREWNFVGRPGVGIDFVMLEHWTVNVEAASTLGKTDYRTSTGGDLEHLYYTTVGAGIRYRF